MVDHSLPIVFECLSRTSAPMRTAAITKRAGNAFAVWLPARPTAQIWRHFLDHPLPWLRYLKADALAVQSLGFDGMAVESPTGERLGEVDGFVVDSVSGRPYYIAVDSGGWFKSRSFLLPVGHAQLDRVREVIVADLARDRVERFPGFDKDVFQKFSEQEPPTLQ